jgi:hypothetical protein
MYACTGGHTELAQWLVREAGSDAKSERDEVRRPSCLLLCVRRDLECRVGVVGCAGRLYGDAARVCGWIL